MTKTVVFLLACFHFILNSLNAQGKEGNVYTEESFIITRDEVSELMETIRRVEKELLSGAYWDHIPDPKKCEYSKLVMRIKG